MENAVAILTGAKTVVPCHGELHRIEYRFAGLAITDNGTKRASAFQDSFSVAIVPEFCAILLFWRTVVDALLVFENSFRDENTLKGQQRVARVSSAV
jgi:hypothetical protein